MSSLKLNCTEFKASFLFVVEFFRAEAQLQAFVLFYSNVMFIVHVFEPITV